MTDFSTGPVEHRDARSLARLHRQAFPGFFLAQLGEPFLREFYRGFVDDPSSITVVARDEHGCAVGAVVGTSEPASFFRRLLRRRLLGLGIASFRALVRRPRTLGRLARGALYRGEVGNQLAPAGALLSSICTSPDSRGTGLGRRLISEWEGVAADMGARTAHLSTDALENERVNRFYSEIGWICDRQYSTREGRQMNLYTKDLTP